MGISQLLFFKAPTFSQVTADNGSGAKEDAAPVGSVGWNQRVKLQKTQRQHLYFVIGSLVSKYKQIST